MLLARNDTIETLEIIDERGHAVGSVTKPSDPRLFGSDKGTVYLARPLPSLTAAAHSAQAA